MEIASLKSRLHIIGDDYHKLANRITDKPDNKLTIFDKQLIRSVFLLDVQEMVSFIEHAFFTGRLERLDTYITDLMSLVQDVTNLLG